MAKMYAGIIVIKTANSLFFNNFELNVSDKVNLARRVEVSKEVKINWFTISKEAVVTIFLARLLEPSDFGLVAMVSVIIGIAQVFTNVGLGGALIQRRRVLPVHYSSVFFVNIFIGSILTLITFFSALNRTKEFF